MCISKLDDQKKYLCPFAWTRVCVSADLQSQMCQRAGGGGGALGCVTRAVYFNNFHFIHQLSILTSGPRSCSSFITSAGQPHTLAHIQRMCFKYRGGRKKRRKKKKKVQMFTSVKKKEKEKQEKNNNQTSSLVACFLKSGFLGLFVFFLFCRSSARVQKVEA